LAQCKKTDENWQRVKVPGAKSRETRQDTRYSSQWGCTGTRLMLPAMMGENTHEVLWARNMYLNLGV
jgi:hypothetical protein